MFGTQKTARWSVAHFGKGRNDLNRPCPTCGLYHDPQSIKRHTRGNLLASYTCDDCFAGEWRVIVSRLN